MRYGYRRKQLFLVIEARRYGLLASGLAVGFFLLSALIGHGWIAPDGFTTLLAIPTSTGNESISAAELSKLVNPHLYGQVTAAELPWSSTPPARLRLLQEEHGAARLVAAFRTTLPRPLYEELANVKRGAELLAGTVIQPGELFSINRALGPYTRARGYRDGPMYADGQLLRAEGGGVCKVATNLYNAAVLAGLEIVERHPHSMMVSYIAPGRDAAVTFGGKDLRIRNNQQAPVIIWSEVHGHTLYVAIYSNYQPPKITWEHQLISRSSPPLHRRAARDLPPGEERVVFPGYDSVTVRTWIVIHHTDRPAERRNLGVTYYRALPRVIEYGPEYGPAAKPPSPRPASGGRG
ncbi:MAG: VanW family protein [Limnochordales bacterium]|nr:VanW family protein [Limnochordales bacterium]